MKLAALKTQVVEVEGAAFTVSALPSFVNMAISQAALDMDTRSPDFGSQYRPGGLAGLYTDATAFGLVAWEGVEDEQGQPVLLERRAVTIGTSKVERVVPDLLRRLPVEVIRQLGETVLALSSLDFATAVKSTASSTQGASSDGEEDAPSVSPAPAAPSIESGDAGSTDTTQTP